MALQKNQISVRGWINYLKRREFQDGRYAYSFSISLAVGKDQAGNLKREYMQVQLSSDASKSNEGRVVEGSFVSVEGRLRNQKGNDGKQYVYIEGFDFFQLMAPKEQGQQSYQRPQQQQQPQQNNYNQSPQPQQYQQQNAAPPPPNFQQQDNYKPGGYQPRQGNPSLDDIPF